MAISILFQNAHSQSHLRYRIQTPAGKPAGSQVFHRNFEAVNKNISAIGFSILLNGE